MPPSAFRRALAVQRERLGATDPATRETELRYVRLLALRGEYADAHALSERLVTHLRAEPDADATLLGRVLGAHAIVISNTGPMELAESLRREQLDLYERIYGPSHARTLSARNDLATVLYGMDRYDEAEPLFATVLDERRRQFGGEHPAVATVASNLANTRLAQHRPDEARPEAEEALRVRLAVYGENHHTTALSLRTLAMIEQERGDLTQARSLLERAVAAYTAALGAENRQMLGALNDLAVTRMRLADPDPDCALATRALAISHAQAEPDAPESQYQFALLGACRAAQGDATGQIPLRTALAAMREAFGEKDRRVRNLVALADSLKAH